MDFSSSLLKFGHRRQPAVFASFWSNIKAKIFTTVGDVHIFPLRNVVIEPIPHSQNVLIGTNDRSQNHDTLARFEGET